MNEPSADPAAAAPLYVDDREALERFVLHVETCDVIALDTEANSLHAYRERTCIVQVTAGDVSAVLDVIALEDLTPLRRAVETATPEVIFHGGDYDISILSRDHGFRFERVFDTMIAATLLGDEKVGLADLVREAFDVELDKRFQKADWARRPLTDEQLDYLHRDTAYLPGLRERFSARLREADLEEEAGIEFRRLAAREGKPVAFDPEGWRRIKGAGRLDAVGRAILSRLHVWREREAERRDVPPFKVLSPRTMHALAAHPPTDTRGTQALSAVGPRERRRYGNAILAALREGRRLAAEGRAPGKPARPRLPREEMVRRGRERKREDALRRWRRAEAEAREVPPLVVLPNPALQWIVRERPRDVDALAAHPDVGNKRAARYGRAILETLNGTG